MSKYGKILLDIMSGRKDHNINFEELKTLLLKLGFDLNRISGSHHIFTYEGISELIDIQCDKRDHSKAKAYQVKQVREFINKYLGGVNNVKSKV